MVSMTIPRREKTSSALYAMMEELSEGDMPNPVDMQEFYDNSQQGAQKRAQEQREPHNHTNYSLRENPELDLKLEELRQLE